MKEQDVVSVVVTRTVKSVKNQVVNIPTVAIPFVVFGLFYASFTVIIAAIILGVGITAYEEYKELLDEEEPTEPEPVQEPVQEVQPKPEPEVKEPESTEQK